MTTPTRTKVVSAAEAVALIRDGDTVATGGFVGIGFAENLAIGETIARSLVKIVSSLRERPRWLVAKGGITSSEVATAALGVRRALVLGQALPGVPVWQLGPETRWPGLGYVVFPGNVGGVDALGQLVASLD